MLKMLFLTLVGFSMFGGSVRSGYLYLLAAEEGHWYAWIFALASIICLIFSGIAFLLAARSHNPYQPKENHVTEAQNDPQIATIGVESALQKNNEIVSQWRKTNHMKDKMTMIKIASNAQKPPSAP